MSAPRYAGFWVRLVADVIDSLLIWAVSWVLQYAIFGAIYWVWVFATRLHGGGGLPPFSDAFNGLWIQAVGGALELAIGAPYYIWGQFRFGTTLGKRLFRIYVVQYPSLKPMTLKQSFIRFLGYAVSYLPIGCGYLMVAFHPQKRALHDLMAGTASIYRPKKSN